MINIAIADDHALIREGLSKILSYEKDLNIVAESCSGEDLIKKIEGIEVEIVLLDINMYALDGIETLKIIKNKWNKIKVIILTVEKQRRKIREAMDLGASGYVLKESAGSEITNAIRTVYAGGKYIDKSLIDSFINDVNIEGTNNLLDSLTNRELRILLEISNGLKNKDIAEKLYLSEKTIKNYVTAIFKKIGVEDRVHATIFAINNGIEGYYNRRVYKKIEK
ncbi:MULTISPECIES: response regulator transcription factor [Clostridium]|uniref:response regulator transcription factor n=1 Tax=Clostridium TaxID=1485 RepID=UPI0029016773|nr:response regulator transcription factor [Clostridium sp.]MDU1823421.1 response regulator transcription factor [Clostridium sp.]MDU1842559.1 response regulator transcription factor [Clostridium sp.]MDU2690582.1 response regulator transcription factor [Clostridium sp.]MDU2956521.1 response regulator transcription factor [Clostridium sp.]MDU3107029.1 response regulator transcription factor [Clostridium sp.]